MELKYKNWNDISVNTFIKLKALPSLSSADEIEILDANVRLLSVLCDCSEDDISKLNAKKFSKLIDQTTFLKTMPKVNIKEKYNINGKDYRLFLSLKDMSIAQYIDFQTYYKDKDNNVKELLSCFLIPKGKKYGEDYSIDEVINDIGEHLSIVDANSIMFFFVILYQSLTKVTLTYLIKELKKMKKKNLDKEMIEKKEQAIKELRKAMDLLPNGNGYIW